MLNSGYFRFNVFIGGSDVLFRKYKSHTNSLFWLIYSVNCIIKPGNMGIGLCTGTINQLMVLCLKNMTRLDGLETLLRDCAR